MATTAGAAAELIERCLDRRLAELFFADIAGQEDGVAALVLDEFARVVRILVLVEINDGYLCALTRHGDGDGAADAAVTAGDQCDFVLELADTGKLRGVVRLRRHLALAGMRERPRQVGLMGRQCRGHALSRRCVSPRP